MFATVNSATISGLMVQMVQVETDVSDGLPGLNLIGYLSAEVREAGARVRSAISNSGIALPPKRMVVSLAPADIPKRGAHMDLAIAVSILSAMNKIPTQKLMSAMIVGEISLLGTVEPVKGVLLIVQEARKAGLSVAVVPTENLEEASLVPDMTIVGVRNITEVMDFFKYGTIPEKTAENAGTDVSGSGEGDFSDVMGQEQAKRAALISASGYHNLFLIGPPGSGKTMIASRLGSIMPPMNYEESLELTGIYSTAGLLTEGEPLMRVRPFRAPHHTITPSALIGGGIVPKPGEVTLSNHGILFLDELTEYKRVVLELMRQPLEEHKVHVSRVNATFTFPADFLLVAAANPCPCGYYPDLSKCHCREGEIRNYFGKISGPLLDRIDLCVRVEPVKFDSLFGKPSRSRKNRPEADGKNTLSAGECYEGIEIHEKHAGECDQGIEICDESVRKYKEGIGICDERGIYSSVEMRNTVMRVWNLEQERYKNESYCFNGRIPPGDLDKWCGIGNEGRELLRTAYERMGLSARACHRILRVARTIADIENSDTVLTEHLLEALGYRMDEKLDF